ncbi:36030_t:CDS:1 [Racocetra persica]|uniref:36030_t:CDS:1 n=1 Tax=Racocetra persica TaxID=160502 RepID=A0ACA9QF97_9GLOM|nr:36030_t:CDS:1 [Racocetra persica]
MSTSNKDSEPIRANDVLAQLNMTQASLESNLECLLLEKLRVVCKGIDVSDLGLKKEVVAKLARESRAGLCSEVSVDDFEPSKKKKSVQPQPFPNQVKSFLKELDVF